MLMESNTLCTMTVLAVTSFEILAEDAGMYAHITADVDVVVGNSYEDGPITAVTACEAKVLLADDTDIDQFRYKAEQLELAEDVSLWEYVDNPF